LRSRTDRRRRTEITIAVQALNGMLELGRPNSVRIVQPKTWGGLNAFTNRSVQHSQQFATCVRMLPFGSS
jgi:hypothetical protein